MLMRSYGTIGKILPGRPGRDCLGMLDHRCCLLLRMAGDEVHILDKTSFAILISILINMHWVECLKVCRVLTGARPINPPESEIQ